MNKILTIVMVLVALSLQTNSQSFKTVSGIVVDSESQEPLAFASIQLGQSGVGTVANSNGEFTIHFKQRSESEYLTISYVGYENYIISITKLTFLHKNVFEMKTKHLVLEEVIIESDSLTAKEVVEKAISRIKENYPSNPFIMDCFFREIEWENDTCVQVTEAAFQLYDKKYNTNRASLQERIRTQAIRRSISYRQIQGFNNLGSAIVDLVENNDVRYQKGILKTRYNEYRLDSISYYNNKPVYVISASNRLDRATMIIGLQSLAFVSIVLERRNRKLNEPPYYYNWKYADTLNLGRVMFRYKLEFREVNDLMYPTYMSEEELAHIYNPITGKVKIEKKEKLEMVINKLNIWDEEKFEGEKLTRKYKVDIGEYDHAFWKHYNTLKLNPVDEQSIRDLEKEISLNEQFKYSKQ